MEQTVKAFKVASHITDVDKVVFHVDRYAFDYTKAQKIFNDYKENAASALDFSQDHTDEDLIKVFDTDSQYIVKNKRDNLRVAITVTMIDIQK